MKKKGSHQKNKPRYQTLQGTVPESPEQPFKKGAGINENGKRWRRMRAYCSLSHFKLLEGTRKAGMGKLKQFNSNSQL